MLNNKYWEDRYRTEEKARELADKRVAFQLQGVYQQHANNIQKEIDSFWQKYADNEGITKLEAKQRADKLDMVNVEFKARQLVERANRLRKRGKKVTSDDFTRTENDLMRLYNLKMKTSRLEVLQANIKLHQYDLALSEFEIIDRHLVESIRRENIFSAGVLNMTLGSYESSKISADSIVYANFNNATWSSRVWERQNELRNIVKKGVADTVLRGKGTNVLINSLKKEFDVSYGYARRLAVTESARVYSEAQKGNYDANGVEWFEIMTELKACPICQPFNGRIFKVSEMVPALNAPPFHPNCRCTTVPHFMIDPKRLGKDTEKEINLNGDTISEFNERKTIDKAIKSGKIVSVSGTTIGHTPPGKRGLPNSVVQHDATNGDVLGRTYYGARGFKTKDIHFTNHKQPARHPYGKIGEHAHDFVFDDEGKFVSRNTRELTDDERKENQDILWRY